MELALIASEKTSGGVRSSACLTGLLVSLRSRTPMARVTAGATGPLASRAYIRKTYAPLYAHTRTLADSRRGSESTYCGYWSWEITIQGSELTDIRRCSSRILHDACITDMWGDAARGAWLGGIAALVRPGGCSKKASARGERRPQRCDGLGPLGEKYRGLSVRALRLCAENHALICRTRVVDASYC